MIEVKFLDNSGWVSCVGQYDDLETFYQIMSCHQDFDKILCDEMFLKTGERVPENYYNTHTTSELVNIYLKSDNKNYQVTEIPDPGYDINDVF